MFKSLLTNHPLVNILFAVVLVMGSMSFFELPREQDPEINFNWVMVTTVLPGASAEDVEELVTGPLEDAMRNVQDIRWVISSSRESSSSILIRFRDLTESLFDKRINDVRREVQNKANDELPEDATDPYILEVTTSSGFPTAMVVVEGQADDERLGQQARIVKEDLERINGVDAIVSIGLQDPEMHVEFSPRELDEFSRVVLITQRISWTLRIASSSGPVTNSSTSSADAPGNTVVTIIQLKLISGSCSRGNSRKDMAPITNTTAKRMLTRGWFVNRLLYMMVSG